MQLKLVTIILSFSHIVLYDFKIKFWFPFEFIFLSVNGLNLDQSKILLFDKQLTLTIQSGLSGTVRKRAFRNTFRKGENDGNQHFPCWPQCFLPCTRQSSILESNLFCCLQRLSIWASRKILLFGKEVKQHSYAWTVSLYSLSVCYLQSSFSLKSSLTQRMVTDALEKVFQLHGAIKLSTPLLIPRPKIYESVDQYACLMDHSGRLVGLPFDLRVCYCYG